MSRAEKKEQTRQRILEAAGRRFRNRGFGGAGVDGLAQDAGVTSGAFYVHFGSKAAAFQETVVLGISGLREWIRQLQNEHGNCWWQEFVRSYLGEKRTCDLSESCALQSLTPELARSDEGSRTVFETALMEVALIVASGPASADAPTDVDTAWSALASLIGGVTLARAVNDPALAERIADSLERALLPSLPPRRTPIGAGPHS